MGKLRRQIWYDIQAGTLQIWYYYLIYLVAVIFVTESIYSKMAWLDCISGYFRGIIEASRMEQVQSFRIPIEWFLFHIGYLFFVVRYPFEDYAKRGYQFLIRSESKGIWWLSKSLWVIGTAVGYCLLFYIATFLWSQLLGREIVWQQSDRWGFALGSYAKGKVIWLLFGIPILVSTALSAFVLFLSFFWNQAAAVIGMITVITASAYWKHPWLIGNYTMLYRYDFIADKWEKQLFYGTVICIILTVLCCLLGYVHFCRREWIKKE